ncbi:hypothetical protein BJX64DRAFT_302451 [Aspergillus heterothallicus]
MSHFPFTITTHTIPSQHIREYPRATRTQDQNATLTLHVKKYTPVDNPTPQPGDVTIRGAGDRELYEPLWTDLHAHSRSSSSADSGFRIRAIWIADAVNQGSSGVGNKRVLGDDPSWFDTSRDMLHMVNHFRDEMPRPIISVGHSAGAVAQIFLALIHPRLFTTQILIEPFVHNGRDPESSRSIFLRAKQDDMWASRGEALTKSQKLVKGWDPRVRERYAQFAFHEIPAVGWTSCSARKDAGAVRSTTPVSQEVMSYMHGDSGRGGDSSRSPPHDPLAVPDMIGGLSENQVFYRPEPMIVWRLLPHLLPTALFVSGETSALSQGGNQARAAGRTGTGVGGSGGVQYGRVKDEVVAEVGHLVPMEKVGEVTGVVGPWIAREVGRWREEERRVKEGWKKGNSEGEGLGFSD